MYDDDFFDTFILFSMNFFIMKYNSMKIMTDDYDRIMIMIII